MRERESERDRRKRKGGTRLAPNWRTPVKMFNRGENIKIANESGRQAWHICVCVCVFEGARQLWS